MAGRLKGLVERVQRIGVLTKILRICKQIRTVETVRQLQKGERRVD